MFIAAGGKSNCMKNVYTTHKLSNKNEKRLDCMNNNNNNIQKKKFLEHLSVPQ